MSDEPEEGGRRDPLVEKMIKEGRMPTLEQIIVAGHRALQKHQPEDLSEMLSKPLPESAGGDPPPRGPQGGMDPDEDWDRIYLSELEDSLRGGDDPLERQRLHYEQRLRRLREAFAFTVIGLILLWITFSCHGRSESEIDADNSAYGYSGHF